MDRKEYLSNITEEDRKLIKLFQDEVNRINLLYMKAIQSDDITKANQLMQQIKKISNFLTTEYGKRADVRIPQEYVKGSSYIDDLIQTDTAVIEALTEEEVRTYLDELGPIHKEAVNALVDNSKNYVRSSLDGMERQALTMVNELQQTQLREQLAKGIISGEGSSNQRLIDYFTSQGISGFKDRGGKYRSMDRYVDMLARTETSIANTQGTINRAIELGITKFGIVEHPDCCEECAEMNGDVVDISQGTVELPPFHPNCRGYIIAVLDEEDWEKSVVRMNYEYNQNKRASTPEERVSKALDIIENSSMYLPYEQGAMVSLDGKILRVASGDNSELLMTRGDVSEPYIFTHNHTNSSMFSSQDLKAWASWKNEYGFRASSKLGTYSLYAESRFDRAVFKMEYEKLYESTYEKATNDILSVVQEFRTGTTNDYMIREDGTYFYQKDNPLEFDRFADEHFWKYFRESLESAAKEVPGVKFEYIPSDGIEKDTTLNKMYLQKIDELHKMGRQNIDLSEDDKIDLNKYL